MDTKNSVKSDVLLAFIENSKDPLLNEMSEILQKDVSNTYIKESVEKLQFTFDEVMLLDIDIGGV
jgi:hypothetical protein